MKEIISNIALFFSLILLQVLVFNNMLLFGYINPMVYILFVILFPIRKERGLLLVSSFLLGLIIDFFLDSGGTNAAATLAIAYFRLPILKWLMRKSEIDFLVFKITKLPFTKMLSFIAIITLIHHFIIFSLEYFNFAEITTILSRTILTSIFTIILIIFSLLLINKNN
ncbi:MAG: rod shape-determining protein MreD [Flavobacteriales bacterium]|nr:MAG: rod shape-determining protein MreD [Flavobacteriales bacterium]PIE49423.1 MAG: rod shape-determining protein MreD [Flavobacteriales bacterium]